MSPSENVGSIHNKVPEAGGPTRMVVLAFSREIMQNAMVVVSNGQHLRQILDLEIYAYRFD